MTFITDPALRLFIMLAALLAVWLELLWRPRKLPGVKRQRPLLIGHRGVRHSLPENTLAAFQEAFEAGLDGIEFDVQQTRDGVLVIRHDEQLASGETLSSLTLEELREHEPERPTLDELFELARRYPGRLLNLEIKTTTAFSRGLEKRVVRAVRDSGLAERVLISSFHPVALAKVRLCAPELRTALLYYSGSPPPLRSGLVARCLHVDALHPEHTLIDEALLRQCGARKLPVNSWTVNDEAEVERLRALGVNAIMADDPQALLRAAGRAGTRQAPPSRKQAPKHAKNEEEP